MGIAGGHAANVKVVSRRDREKKVKTEKLLRKFNFCAA